MYEIFVQLCENQNVTPYQVSKNTGVTQATFSQWKSGSTPRDTTLQKIADYFGVTLAYLKGESPDPRPSPAPVSSDEPTASELMEYLEMLRSRSECRMLFSLAKDATPEDVRRAVAVIEALRREEGRE